MRTTNEMKAERRIVKIWPARTSRVPFGPSIQGSIWLVSAHRLRFVLSQLGCAGDARGKHMRNVLIN